MYPQTGKDDLPVAQPQYPGQPQQQLQYGQQQQVQYGQQQVQYGQQQQYAGNGTPLQNNTIAQYNQQYQAGAGQYMAPSTIGGGFGDVNNRIRNFMGTKKPWEDLYDPTQPLTHGDYSWLADREAFYIQQEVEVLDALAAQGGCGQCVETHNKYSIYDAVTNEPLMFVQEVDTNFLELYCFKPTHGSKLQVFDIRPGTTEKNKMMFLIDKPLKVCGSCCVCDDLCSVQTRTYDSHGMPIGQTRQPIGGGGFTPTMMSMDRNGAPFAKSTGPSFCIGGLCENCKESKFKVAHQPSGQMMAEIIKEKPKGGMDHAVSLLTDADSFTIQLPKNMPVPQKLEMLSSVVLLDYLFFEFGTAIKRTADGGTQVTCCELYCCGCLCPCTCGGGGNSQQE